MWLHSIVLSFFIARTRTVLDAGFALKTHGSLVKGFTPLRAFVAGLFFSFMFIMPANLKEPFFFSSPTATPMSASTTALTSLAFREVFSATAERAPDCDIAPAFIAFIAAFIAFIGAMMMERWRFCVQESPC